MGTTTRGIAYPDSLTQMGNIAGIFAGLAQSVDAALPVIRVASLTELNTTLPPVTQVQLAVVGAAGAGMDAGSVWSRTDVGWVLVSPVHITDYTTFKSTLGSCPNLKVTPGGSLLLDPGTNACVFTIADGTYMVVEDGTWTNIAYASGRMAIPGTYPLGYRLTRSGLLLRGLVGRTSGTFAVNEAIFTLPSGTWPTSTVYFNARGNPGAIGDLYINTTGACKLQGVTGRTASYYSFDGLTIPNG